jgi:hypothetical protein
MRTADCNWCGNRDRSSLLRESSRQKNGSAISLIVRDSFRVAASVASNTENGKMEKSSRVNLGQKIGSQARALMLVD